MNLDLETGIIAKIFVLSTISFVVTILWTPLLTKFLFKYKLGKSIRDTGKTPIFSKLHKKKAGTPTMGGLLIWVTTAVMALFFFLVPMIPGLEAVGWLNFLTRSETLLPLGALVAAAVVGLIDDWIDIKRKDSSKGGLTVAQRLIIYSAIGVVGAWWFYFKLDWDLITVPFIDTFAIGPWYIPLFILVIVSTAFSVNETDGLDGLAGGVLATSFGAYAAIAFVQGRYDLAAFCGVISGTLLAFLWFNVHPARFFMGDTGSMALGTTLGIVAMLTNTVFILPIISFILVLESLSVLIQVSSKKIRGKRVFLSAPLHHHFEAKDWPETKIVMRAWIISSVTAIIGLIIALASQISL